MNYYEILGIDTKASKEEIENAYIRLKEKYNPHMYIGKSKEKAEAKISQIIKAYEFLMESEERTVYNENIRKKERSGKTEIEFFSNIEKLNALNILENNIREFKKYTNEAKEKQINSNIK